jgi:hypothetical protein
MNLVWTRSRVLCVAVLVMLAALVPGGGRGINNVSEARFANPDSYYKLVLLEDHEPQKGLHFVARDNAPFGNWVHWSLPHSWTVWQLHHALTFAGLSQREALRWAGASVTTLSMLLLAMLVALAVASSASHRAALVSTMTLATSIPLLSYGRIDQVTHHIFMLVPVAAAAACFFRDQKPYLQWWPDAFGGAMLGLALWISPEMMSLVCGMAAVRAAIRLESGRRSPSLIPVALGMLAVVTLGWVIDPPPPGYGAWALDHISLSWLLLAAMLAGLLLLTEALAAGGWSLWRVIPTLMLATTISSALWLTLVPGALRGPAGLIPEELKSLWWDHIKELQSVNEPYQWVAYLAMPLIASVLAGVAAFRTRRLWLALLALMALLSGLLGFWHLRMGAAAGLVAALTLGTSLTRFPIFVDGIADSALSAKDQVVGLVLTLLPVLQLLTVLGLLTVESSPSRSRDCQPSNIAPALNALPPATILAPVFSAPELLYFTHHRTVAGPYHHNVSGILDVYRAWSDTEGSRAKVIIENRGIDYVLVCRRIQRQLVGAADAPSLATRTIDGRTPEWLTPVPLGAGADSQWRLYRVVTGHTAR